MMHMIANIADITLSAMAQSKPALACCIVSLRAQSTGQKPNIMKRAFMHFTFSKEEV